MSMEKLLTNRELDASIPVQRASFREMRDANAQDYLQIHAAEDTLQNQLADRLLAYLAALDVSNGAPISILDHCLLTATLAAEDGRSDEYIACALLHDIGDLLAPADHGAFAAAIVRPYVSDGLWFMTRYHPEFQMAYQTANNRADPTLYLRHRDSPYFEMTQEFCQLYDQRAFDPTLAWAELHEFAPLMRRVFNTAPSQ